MRPYEQRRHVAGLCIWCAQPKEDKHMLRCASCRAKVCAHHERWFARTYEPKTERGQRLRAAKLEALGMA